MNSVNMGSVDLNLLRVFDALLEEGSVTRAGARLGLSQSAVSHSLGRLRSLLGDDLFVRTSVGIRPTARAAEMGPDVHAALRQIQSALSVKAFEPMQTERRFTLIAGSFSSAVLIPRLVAQMAERAPRAELVIADGAADLLEQLDARRTDFIVGSIETAPERVQTDVMLRETLVWVVRAGHPLTKGKVTLERLVETPHVAIRRRPWEPDGRQGPALIMRATWEDSGAFENELRENGLKRRIGVTVPDAYSALAVVRRSDMAALIPRRLAEMSAQSGFLAMVSPPYKSPTVELNLLSLRERMAEPAQAWMHGLLTAIGKDVDAS
jgi:DNA-binding transcriptional LysR family regulator